jgi:hypothetical protein
MQDRLAENEILHGTIDEYEILNLIGRGGMGAVYRARRTSDNSIWAVKEMRPPPNTPADEVEENRKLFAQEVELLRRLNHPNLLRLADEFENNGRPTMVIEFVPGQTLEARIREANAPLLEQQVIGYGIQLCRVLHYLHSLQPPVIYRDLKPPNIMITPEGVVKLIDFGVARTYKKRKAKDTIAMGSAGYAPPEQYGKGQTDARSDIYALGATLLHLLTNQPPVPLQPPQPGYIHKFNPSVDPATEQIIITAMALDREQRYQTGMEMEQALHSRLDTPFVDPTERTVVPPAVSPAAATPTVPAPASPAPAQAAAGGIACGNCGYVNKAKARFCANCGTPLGAPPTARLLATSPRGTWEVKLEKMPCNIGRRDPRQNHYPAVDLAEHDRGIASRNHATIQRDGDNYTITDLGSTNGTMINGVNIQANVPQRLHQGDRIKVGEVELEFRWS